MRSGTSPVLFHLKVNRKTAVSLVFSFGCLQKNILNKIGLFDLVIMTKSVQYTFFMLKNVTFEHIIRLVSTQMNTIDENG